MSDAYAIKTGFVDDNIIAGVSIAHGAYIHLLPRQSGLIRQLLLHQLNHLLSTYHIHTSGRLGLSIRLFKASIPRGLLFKGLIKGLFIGLFGLFPRVRKRPQGRNPHW